VQTISIPRQLTPEALDNLRQEEVISKAAKLSPADAQAILAAWSYPRQRKIRDPRLMSYKHQMEAGHWRKWSQIIVDVLPDGTLKLINGYHRLISLSRLDPDTDYRLPVTIEYRYTETMQDVADDYAVIDIGGTRSQADAIHAQDLANKWGVSFETLKACGAAGGLILAGFAGGRSNSLDGVVGRSLPGRIEWMHTWENEIKHADILVKMAPNSKGRKLVYRQAVMAVMLMTLRYTPEKAYRFWEPVITGIGLYPEMPELVLRNYLTNTPVRGLPEHIYARYVANCWNNYYRNSKMSKLGGLRKQGINEPIVIEGTEFSRGRRDKAIQKKREEQQARMAQARAVKNSPEKITPPKPEPEFRGEDQEMLPLPEILDY
jgi:hypothetical protein